MHPIHMARFFKRSPGVFASNVHLPKEDRNIAVSNVMRKDPSGNIVPALFGWLLFAELSVNDGTAVSFHNSTVRSHYNSFDEALVDQNLAIQFTDVIVR